MCGRFVIAFLVCVGSSACATNKPITAIAVREWNEDTARSLTPHELAEFEHHWAQKVKIDWSE